MGMRNSDGSDIRGLTPADDKVIKKMIRKQEQMMVSDSCDGRFVKVYNDVGENIAYAVEIF